MPVANTIAEDLELITALAKEAGKIGMRWFGKEPQVWMKEGQSPVSEADFAIDNFLKEKLLAVRPDYGWLSEETEDNGERLATTRSFVVDPIDGTRGFINGMKRWCVSVAVVENNRPIARVLECPVLEQTITAHQGHGAYLNGGAISSLALGATDMVRVTGPRSLENAVISETLRTVEKTPFIPSLAYRIAMVAMGDVDLILARASAKDWDLAAADLIACEAGARLTDLDNNELIYNCRDVRHGALVASHADNHNEMLDLAAQAMSKQRVANKA